MYHSVVANKGGVKFVDVFFLQPNKNVIGKRFVSRSKDPGTLFQTSIMKVLTTRI